jgi:nucleotide-binding universal stress UspA family protein
MPTVIHGVVCMVDLSTLSPQVVTCGAELARHARVPLHLLHVVPDPQDRVHATTLFERGGDFSRGRDLARQRMQAFLREAGAQGTVDVAFGDPVEQVLAFLERMPSCLVVSASRGVPVFRRLLIGTVVERLSRALPGPMLVVKAVHPPPDGPFRGFQRMVVGCDANGRWLQLGPLMPLLQGASSGAVHLVHALERPLDAVEECLPTEDYSRTQQALQQRLRQSLSQRARDDFPQAAAIAVTIAAGDPARTLLTTAGAADADLIVVGVRRSGRVERWVAGSTTEAVLRHATCSVLTLPEVDVAPAAEGDDP